MESDLKIKKKTTNTDRMSKLCLKWQFIIIINQTKTPEKNQQFQNNITKFGIINYYYGMHMEYAWGKMKLFSIRHSFLSNIFIIFFLKFIQNVIIFCPLKIGCTLFAFISARHIDKNEMAWKKLKIVLNEMSTLNSMPKNGVLCNVRFVGRLHHLHTI